MRFLIAVMLAAPLLAQEAAKPEPAKPDEAKKEEAKAEAESPVPVAEPSVTGTLDVGYRFANTAGNANVYRSVVNLGEGPKLFSTDFTIQDATQRFFDRIEARAYNWGGDPYNTAHFSARKAGLYDFRADYRNIAYFNYLPSFANPQLDLGLLASQRTFDTTRRISEFQLDLFPGRRIIPYLAFSRNAESGRGITTFVGNGNEYPVANQLRSELNNYRGGVRLEMRRWHATLEQGGTTLKDDQQVFTSDLNPGNRTTPFNGQSLVLNRLQEAYGVRGTGIYSKLLVTGSPFSWLNLFGQFLYSQPETDTRFSLAAGGNLASFNPLLFYNSQLDLFAGNAKMPHTSGNAGAEMRLGRFRIIESWLTDRMHTASAGVLAETLFLSGGTITQLPLAVADKLTMNYNRQQVDVLFDLTSRITLRGGHRYEWGDARAPATVLTPTGDLGELKRHVGLAGATWRSGQKLSLNVDFEGASTDRVYFRTSMADYRRARIRAAYQLLGNLALGANFNVFSNENPAPGISYEFLSRENTVSATWTPNGGKRVSVLAEYSRSSLRSGISYRVPQDLSLERSFYRDNAHTGTALVDLNLPEYSGMTPKVSLGGSFFKSSGSRPSSFYQPSGRVLLPVHKHVALTAEWRWYGFAERFYQYEGFRSHLFMTGLRFSR